MQSSGLGPLGEVAKIYVSYETASRMQSSGLGEVDVLEMALEIEELFKPDYFILTGGVANPVAIISEADAMYKYLVDKGLEKERLIKEDQSHSTYENALYSLPIAKELGAELIIVCTSDYHLARSEYNAMSSFINQLENSNIN